MSNYPGPPPEGGPYGAPQEPGQYGQPNQYGQPQYCQYGAPSYGGAPQSNSSKATTSLVLGILSLLCFGLLTGIPAMIIGRNATKEIDASNGTIGGRGMATAGFVTGIIGTLLSVLGIIAMIGMFAMGSATMMQVERTCTSVNGNTTSDC